MPISPSCDTLPYSDGSLGTTKDTLGLPTLCGIYQRFCYRLKEPAFPSLPSLILHRVIQCHPRARISTSRLTYMALTTFATLIQISNPAVTTQLPLTPCRHSRSCAEETGPDEDQPRHYKIQLWHPLSWPDPSISPNLVDGSRSFNNTQTDGSRTLKRIV